MKQNIYNNLLCITKATIFTCFVLWSGFLNAQTKIYLFAGQGSDERLFQYLEFDTTRYKIHHIDYSIPKKKETLKHYSYSLIPQIDLSSSYILIGVSMGGMICSELRDTISPVKTIIISSAKDKNELPSRYRFQRTLPLYKVFPKRVLLGGAKMMQPIVEPDRNKHKEIFKSMLNDKDPTYMKRTIGMIINWRKTGYSPDIIHIHGTKDHTIPYRGVSADYSIEQGSHMITLTEAEKVSEIINLILGTN